MKIKQFLKKLLKAAGDHAKNPIFWIFLILTWTVLMSPMIFGGIMYVFTRNGYWLTVSGGWIALTAPSLPIPVIPLSIAGGITASKIQRKIRRKKENDKQC